MTLKGKKNHYNIKFLSGYGHSISVKNSKIVLKDCHDPFSEPIIEEWYPKNMPYEKIILQGKGYVSTEALSLLTENYRNVILLDTKGKPITYMNPVMESLTATKYRMAQYDAFRDPEKCLKLQRWIVKEKLDSQIRFLKSTENSELNEGIMHLQQIRNNMDNGSPIVHESKTSRIYFMEYVKLIPDRYEFHSRNQSSIRNSKNNATDIINTLLNYGYSILAGEISKYIEGTGLDPYFGFYHKPHTGFQPLVYDMLEPFRWLVEYSVWKLATAHSKGITKQNYARAKNGVTVLDYFLKNRFFEILERAFQMKRKFEFKHGAKTSDGLKSIQEITIAKIMVKNLVDFHWNLS